jgi:hypothetical protein
MRTLSFVTLSAATLALLFIIGCSKSPLPPNAQVQELGEIELAPQTPKHVPLGDGKDLVLTVTGLPDGKIQVDVDIEPKPTDGKVPAFKHAQFTAPSGEKVQLSLGDRFVGFTPKLKTP